MSLPQGIKGVSDVIRPQRAGRIRLGEKKVSAKSGKEYPDKLDHFNFVDAPLVAGVYGDNCRELDILLPVNDRGQVLDTAYMRYAANGWRCRGDGEVAFNREHDLEIDCAGEECQEFLAGDCKRQARFSFVLYRVPGGLSIYDIVTSGRRSIQNLVSGLSMLDSLFGQIDSIPLKLYLEPYETTFTDKDGQQRKSVAYCLRLDVAASLLDVKRLTLGRVEMPELPVECSDDHYPISIQEQEAAALPEPEVIPAEIIPAIDPNIEIGFDILGLNDQQRQALIAKYQGHDDKLIQYLSAMADRKQAPEAQPEQKPTGTNGKPPHKNWF